MFLYKMEHRRSYATNIHMDIIKLEKAQERDNNSLEELRNLTLDATSMQLRKDYLQQNIIRREKELENLRQRHANVLSGVLDSEITRQTSTQGQVFRNANAVAVRKRVDERKDNKQKEKDMYSKLQEDRCTDVTEKEMDYQYKRYCKITDSLPDYIQKNLSDMPNNKGYVWRGCWFFGEKDEEYNQPRIMFEKHKGGLLNIYEYYHTSTHTEYRHFEKKGKDKKVMVKGVKRRRIPLR
jgi:hypothetical protein